MLEGLTLGEKLVAPFVSLWIIGYVIKNLYLPGVKYAIEDALEGR